MVIANGTDGGNKIDATLFVDTKEMLLRKKTMVATSPAARETTTPVRLNSTITYDYFKKSTNAAADVDRYLPPRDYVLVKSVEPVYRRISKRSQ